MLAWIDKMIKNYIIIGLVSILIGFGIVLSIKCSKLEKENIELRIKHNTIVDSIKIENNLLNKEILLLSEDLDYYRFKVDSLKTIKQQIIVKTEYIVSENLTEGVELLKKNIKCEKY